MNIVIFVSFFKCIKTLILECYEIVKCSFGLIKHSEAAFSGYAPHKGNKLPTEVKSAPNGSVFKIQVKNSFT